jgi:formiminotetrahydrofolate cyclodeaminase
MTQSPPNPRLVDLPVAHFLDALAAGTPAPGGGAATALAAALGAALAGMTARLTLNRPRYAAVAEEMELAARHADDLRGQLIALIDADAAAFGRLIAAQRLPKDTPVQQITRAEAILRAHADTIQVPLDVAHACLGVLALAGRLAAHGNRNAVDDAAVAALLAHAALVGAARNVRANLRSLPAGPAGENTAQVTNETLDDLLARGEHALHAVLAAADARVDI